MERIVEIPVGSGNKYRYEYVDGKTVYKGKVSSRKVEEMELAIVDLNDFLEDLDYSNQAGEEEWESWIGNFLLLENAGPLSRKKSLVKFGFHIWKDRKGLLLALDEKDMIIDWRLNTDPDDIGWVNTVLSWEKAHPDENISLIAISTKKMADDELKALGSARRKIRDE
jgi:hypothetical protein